MNNQPQQPISYDGDNEINLFKLFSTLWQEKTKIIVATFLFMILSLIYAFNATEKWSVSVSIDTPTSQQVKQYNFNRELINEGIRTLNKNLDAKVNGQVIKIDNKNKTYNELPSIAVLHRNYVSEARMATNQVRFFKNQPLFKAVVAENKLNQIEQNNYAYDWVSKNISFTAQNTNRINYNDKIGTSMNISAIKPGDALVLNRAYLDFINDIMMLRLRDLISAELSFGLQQMVNFNDNTNDVNKIKLEKQINELAVNIQIAKKANIKNFVTQHISLESAPEYAKGYEILSAEKFILLKQLAHYEENSLINSNALLINKWRDYDKKFQLDNFNFYRFTDEPKLPKTRDNPKRPMILVLGTLLGFILSAITVLVMSAIRSKKSTS